MDSIRLKYMRGEEVKYISHLDLMKVFERALRRSHLPIAYSHGFNPHPQMVFGLPLSVGVTSEADYADFEFTDYIYPRDFIERLNKELPTGLRVIDSKRKDTKDNIMSSIALASYIIFIHANVDITTFNRKIEEFMQTPEIIVKKEGKQGAKDVNIRPMIHRLEIKSLVGNNTEATEDNIFCLSMLLSAGSVANLKPELLVWGLKGVTGLELRPVKIHRTGLFTVKEDTILDPLDYKVLSGL